MALQLTNPYLSNLQGNYSKTPATNQYGGSSNGISQVTTTPSIKSGPAAVNPAPKPVTTKAAGAPSTTTASNAAAAQAAAVAAQQRAALISQISAGQQGIQSSGATELRDLTNTYGQNNQSTVQQIQQGQQGINTARENTALNLRRGLSSILDTIRSGTQNGKAQLAGMNATASGATADLARAYAAQGDQQAGDARNAAYVENQGTDQQQAQLDQQRQTAISNFATYRSTETDRISNDLYSQLKTLDANAQAAGVNGQVDYTVRDNLINNAIAQLNAIDQQTSSALAGVSPETQAQIDAAAAKLNAGGAVGYTPPNPESV